MNTHEHTNTYTTQNNAQNNQQTPNTQPKQTTPADADAHHLTMKNGWPIWIRMDTVGVTDTMYQRTTTARTAKENTKATKTEQHELTPKEDQREARKANDS